MTITSPQGPSNAPGGVGAPGEYVQVAIRYSPTPNPTPNPNLTPTLTPTLSLTLTLTLTPNQVTVYPITDGG